jgi:hypothetical protein
MRSLRPLLLQKDARSHLWNPLLAGSGLFTTSYTLSLSSATPNS